MEQRIRELYSDSIYQQALRAFGIRERDARALDGFESFIYEFHRGGGDPGILRVSHSIRRSPELIEGELDWIDHLHRGGAGVSRPLLTRDGERVARIPDGRGGTFSAAAFEKARGAPHRGKDWPRELLGEYGRQIGRMHLLATSYQPSRPDWRRPAWDDPLHLSLAEFIPPNQLPVREAFEDNVTQIRALPAESGAYGLIHQDPHRGNFYLDDAGRITFFDFDDSSYSWFVEDIALAIFYAVMGEEDPAAFTARFLEGFLPGYFAAYPLDLKWFREIPLFLKRRELDLYAVIHRSFDLENLDDPWCIWYLDGRAERLAAREPYLAFDFAGFDYAACR